jgi:hypothetical protein
MVSGLKLEQTPAPNPLPTTLPGGHGYAPPAGKVLTGVADKPVSTYTNTVGKRPAVYEEFVAWGQWLPPIAEDARSTRSRSMMMISTAFGSKNVISPAGIASGAGDSWLIGLAQQLYRSGNITYLRLMAEMNNCENPYAADNCNGSSRGGDYSAAAFKQAWRRVTLIMRGGPITLIDRELHELNMPRLRTSLTYLPTPKVAMVWVPMVAGKPAVPALEPRVYWPGKRWVDWVGTDFYSRYPNWSGLDSFYSDFLGSDPAALDRCAPEDADDGLQRRLTRLLADAVSGQRRGAPQRPGGIEVPRLGSRLGSGDLIVADQVLQRGQLVCDQPGAAAQIELELGQLLQAPADERELRVNVPA